MISIVTVVLNALHFKANTIQLFIDCSKIKRQRWNIGSGAEWGNHNNQVSGIWLSWKSY